MHVAGVLVIGCGIGSLPVFAEGVVVRGEGPYCNKDTPTYVIPLLD